jgi:hypothetical protein
MESGPFKSMYTSLGQSARRLFGERNVRLIRRLSFCHQLGLQPGLDLARMLIGQRAVAAGVDLGGAIQRHRAQLQYPISSATPQHLHEQPLQFLQKVSRSVNRRRCDGGRGTIEAAIHVSHRIKNQRNKARSAFALDSGIWCVNYWHAKCQSAGLQTLY